MITDMLTQLVSVSFFMDSIASANRAVMAVSDMPAALLQQVVEEISLDLNQSDVAQRDHFAGCQGDQLNLGVRR